MCLTGWEFYLSGTGRYNGHPVWRDQDRVWAYQSDDVPIQTDRFRACPVCSLRPTTEKHDGCVRELPGVRAACCGHGHVDTAYVLLNDQDEEALRGWEAVDFFCSLDRPPRWLAHDPDPAGFDIGELTLYPEVIAKAFVWWPEETVRLIVRIVGSCPDEDFFDVGWWLTNLCFADGPLPRMLARAFGEHGLGDLPESLLACRPEYLYGAAPLLVALFHCELGIEETMEERLLVAGGLHRLLATTLRGLRDGEYDAGHALYQVANGRPGGALRLVRRLRGRPTDSTPWRLREGLLDDRSSVAGVLALITQVDKAAGAEFARVISRWRRDLSRRRRSTAASRPGRVRVRTS